MYLLDTSIVSNFLDERRYYPQLTAGILSKPPENIFISIIISAFYNKRKAIALRGKSL